MQQHIQNWMEFLNFQRRLAKRTRELYSENVREWLAFLKVHLGEDPNLEHFEHIELKDFRAWLTHRRNYDNASNALALASVRSFWKFLQKQELLKNEAAHLIKTPKIKKRLPRPLSETQSTFLTENIESSHEEVWMGLRNKALITLLYATGMRIAEALSLRQRDAQKDILHVIGKGNKERQIPLLEEAKESLFAYINACPYQKNFEDPLFFSVRGRPMSSTEANGVLRSFRRQHDLPESLTPHALRHTCATHLMNSSKDMRGIQTLLGHASLSSTQIYTDLDTEKLLEAYAQTHPRAKKG